VEHSSDAITLLNEEGRIVYEGPTLKKLTGFSEEEVLAKSPLDLMHPEDVPRVRETLAQLMAHQGKTERAVFRSFRKDGSVAWIEAVGTNLLDEPHVRAIVVNYRDITEARLAEEAIRANEENLRVTLQELRHFQRLDAIGRLVGGIAHDFNNMVCGITGAAEQLAVRLPKDDARSTQLLSVILEGAERAGDLTRNLLSFARKESADFTPVDVHRVISSALALLHNTMDKRIEVRVELEATGSVVFGVPALLQSVFLNLGINAAHAMPMGGTLWLRSKNVTLDASQCEASPFDLRPGQHVEVEVRDNGCGIAPEDLPRIFEPFFTTKEAGKGTGLGLSAVYGTVQQHQGAITVSSEVGRGTCFRVLLPLTKTRAAHSALCGHLAEPPQNGMSSSE